MNCRTPVLAFVWSGELPAQAIDEMLGGRRVMRRPPRPQVSAFVAARGPQQLRGRVAAR